MKKIGRTPTLFASAANEKTKIHGAHSVNYDMNNTFEKMQDKLRHRLMLARKRLNVYLAQNEDLKREIDAFRLVSYKLCVRACVRARARARARVCVCVCSYKYATPENL